MSSDLTAGDVAVGATAPVAAGAARGPHAGEAASRRAKARARADARLRAYGLAAIAFAVTMLVILLWSVVGRATQAATERYASLPVVIAAEAVDPEGTGDPAVIGRADFGGLVKAALREAYPEVSGRTAKRALYGLVSDGAADDMRAEARAGTLALDDPRPRPLLLSDDATLYLQGSFGTLRDLSAQGTLALALEVDGKTATLASTAPDFAEAVGLAKAAMRDEADGLRRQAARQAEGLAILGARLDALEGEALADARAQMEGFKARRDALQAQADALDARIMGDGALGMDGRMPSVLVHAKGGTFRLTAVSPERAEAQVLLPPDEAGASVPAGAWRLRALDRPEAGRTVSDLQVALLEDMREEGALTEEANLRFLSTGDSREAELAGIKGAVVGSLWTMLVTFLIAFPTGVLAAIYLEEFAPKNRFTDFIEVNINNLAAVPSIVFGLLGLAVFVTFFGVPRSTPLAGGLVLALMTLPTIVIASRAAIRAVPPSIRDGAMGLGASRMQTVFHHVIPLAMPGILTGSILGMAQALGETAPLLLIGMVAFITEVPDGVTDSATVLPVQVFIWSNQSEAAFDYRTAAAIVTLLTFLVVMNLLAILLRKRFERRW